jgi:dCTP deaminase
MILTGEEIVLMRKQGRIVIEPFDESRVNPNSYNLTLSDQLRVYAGTTLDMREANKTWPMVIPPQGLTLRPGEIYLGSTVEQCGSDEFVCCVEGRSSIGRLGIEAHRTAGFGDLGFKSYWTLEISVVKPVRIYPFIQFAQAVFYKTQGPRNIQYKGKYKTQQGPVASKLHEELSGGK